MTSCKFLLLGRFAGQPGPIPFWHTLIGGPADTTVTVKVTAAKREADRVGVRIELAGSGRSVSLSNPHVNVGAYESAPDPKDRFDRVGRAPVLEAMGGSGSATITFDVLPGYLAREVEPKAEFTFVVAGDLLLEGQSSDASDPSRGREVLAAAPRGVRPEVVAVVEVDPDGVRRSARCSHPDYAVDAHAERVGDDPRDGRPRTRVVLGGLAELRPEVVLEALGPDGRPVDGRVEPAPGSLEYNALTVLGARDAAGRALGFRLTVRGQGRHRRGGLA